jgi:hypothetical protein
VRLSERHREAHGDQCYCNGKTSVKHVTFLAFSYGVSYGISLTGGNCANPWGMPAIASIKKIGA